VVAVARKGQAPLSQIARDFGISESCLHHWLKLADQDWADAHLINTALDIHHDDPAFGYRFIADELAALGITAGENRVARLCSQQRIWSMFARKRGCSRKPTRRSTMTW
jgi:hypothetical protein